MRYKCSNCYLIFDEKDLVEDACPSCGTKSPHKMCDKDHVCICGEDVHTGIQYCAECGQPVCPCGSHDVGVISRVTGYLSDVKGWNASKRQELKDRVRVDIT